MRWYPKKLENNDLIYHYTKAETAKIILENSSLKLNPPNNMDDPTEKGDFRYGFSWNHNLREWVENLKGASDPDVLSSNFLLNNYFQKFTKLACFCMTSNGINGFHRPRMWDQYANKHTGVCIGFSLNSIKEIFIETGIPHIVGKVEYKDLNQRHININLSFNLLKHTIPKLTDTNQEIIMMKNLIKDHYLTKNLDYRDENELRVILIIKDDDGEYFVDVKSAIKLIITGCNISNDDKGIITALCSDDKDIYEQSVLNRQYQYVK